MTPEDLEALILDTNFYRPVPAAFADLDEKARARLSSVAQKIHKQMQRGRADKDASPRLAAFVSARPREVLRFLSSPESRRATLALFALCPLSVVSKRDIMIYHDERPAFIQIIEDRRPTWLDDWVAFDLAREFQFLDFPTLRRWVRLGLCHKPETDGYYRMFAWYLMRTGVHTKEAIPPLSRQLLDDPDLLADIDGIFRVETIAFNTNSWLVKRAAADFETWPDAMVRLAAEGHIDRGRLLNLALDGLNLDVKQNQLSGFHGFYKRMAPTAEEVLAHQPAYIALLCHPISHVAKFAIDMLAQVEKLGALDTDAVLDEIGAVFAGDSKGNASAALKLLQKIIGRGPTADRVLATVAEALRHGHADVQAVALDILEKHATCLPADIHGSLAAQTDFIAISLRSRLQALTKEAAPATIRPQSQAAAALVSASYQILSADLADHRILFADDAIAPITSLDDLIAAVSHAVEVIDSPDDIERIVDGISRLAGDRPADFAARTAPLLHRMKTKQGGNSGLQAGTSGIGLAVRDLIYTWLTGVPQRAIPSQSSPYYAYEEGFGPLITHLQAITTCVARGRAHTVLSAPTHRGGWIDPRVWIQRLRQVCGDETIVNSMDFRLSLLRLAPDDRDIALAATGDLPSPVRRLADFALGGAERPSRSDSRAWAAWITAARCRSPHKDWRAEFAELDLDDSCPDGLAPARFSWRADKVTTMEHKQSWTARRLSVTVEMDAGAIPKATIGNLLTRLTQAMHHRQATEAHALPTTVLTQRMETRRAWYGDMDATWVAQWLPYMWPQNPASACMKAAKYLVPRLDENSSGWQPAHGHFQVLFQKNRPWGEASHLLLCMGLIGKDADAKGLAVDALIEGIEGCRFDPALFAEIIARLSAGEWVKHNRLADGLMLVVPVSALHAGVIADALEASLPSLDLRQNNVFRVLEVLAEARAAAPRHLPVAAREALTRISGGGKAVKIARQILAS